MLGRSFNYRTITAPLVLLTSAPAAAIAAPVVDNRASSPVTNVTAQELEKLPSGRNVQDLLNVCPARTIPTVTSRPQGVSTSDPAPTLRCVQPNDLRMIDIYKLHNNERARFGYEPLRWNPMLADNAQTYANSLAQIGRLVHASREGRRSERENISQGLPGWNANQLMGNWLNERRYFVPGIFPNVSTTGDWSQVGHYSQVIWPQTTDIGCGIAQGSGFSWLVCRYSPGGNKDGKPVGQQREKEAPLPPLTTARRIHETPMPQPRGPATTSAPPESILDDLDEAQASDTPKPPPESILDEVGQDPVTAEADGLVVNGPTSTFVVFVDEGRVDDGASGVRSSTSEPETSPIVVPIYDPDPLINFPPLSEMQDWLNSQPTSVEQPTLPPTEVYSASTPKVASTPAYEPTNPLRPCESSAYWDGAHLYVAAKNKGDQGGMLTGKALMAHGIAGQREVLEDAVGAGNLAKANVGGLMMVLDGMMNQYEELTGETVPGKYDPPAGFKLPEGVCKPVDTTVEQPQLQPHEYFKPEEMKKPDLEPM